MLRLDRDRGNREGRGGRGVIDKKGRRGEARTEQEEGIFVSEGKSERSANR
jgi:hypothetical protein